MNFNKRKSFGNKNESPQSEKKFKPGKLSNGGTPQATPGKQQRQNTPKSANKKPQFSPKGLNIKQENVTPSPKTPKLKMFPGTNSLGSVDKNIKKEPISVTKIKKELLSAKKQPGSPKTKQANVNAEKPPSDGEKGPNRHKRRRETRKIRRQELRQKEKELKIKVLEGDVAARHQVEKKIQELEKVNNKSKSLERKLKFFQGMLQTKGMPKNIQAKGPLVQKQQKGKQLKNEKQKQAILKTPAAESDTDTSESEEQSQSKISILAEGESNEEEEASDEEGKEEASDEEGKEEASDEEDEEEASDEEGEEEASDNEQDEEDSDEEETTLSLSNPSQTLDEEDSNDDDESEEESEESDEKTVVQSKKQAVNKKLNQHANKKQPQKQDSNIPSLNDVVGKDKLSRYVVFVGNLPYSATKKELSEHFKKVGQIADIRIPTNEENKPKGFAYVELKDQEAYQKALSLHHTFVGERRINVLYTQSGKKKSAERKGEIKAKNFKLQAMRNQGQLTGSVKADQKRSVRRAKKKQFDKKQNA